jgi:hypothetical protein
MLHETLVLKLLAILSYYQINPNIATVISPKIESNWALESINWVGRRIVEPNAVVRIGAWIIFIDFAFKSYVVATFTIHEFGTCFKFKIDGYFLSVSVSDFQTTIRAFPYVMTFSGNDDGERSDRFVIPSGIELAKEGKRTRKCVYLGSFFFFNIF